MRRKRGSVLPFTAGQAKETLAAAGKSFVALALAGALFGGLMFFGSVLRNKLETMVARRTAVAEIAPAPAAGEPAATWLWRFVFGESADGAPGAASVAAPSPVSPSRVEAIAQLPAGAQLNTFTDLFSGNGRIDTASTTLRQDAVTTAFLFAPAIAFTAGGPAIAERPCAPGAACLRAENGAFSFAGRAVALPPRTGTVRNVSTFSAGGADIAGIVTERAGMFEGYLYAFENGAFRNIDPAGGPIVVSQYPGVFGGGGAADDWIAVYGAYRGAAWRVRGTRVDDLSRFFGIRAMAGGFAPAVVRKAGDDPAWFVHDAAGSPKLLKLFQNGTGEIAGAADVTARVAAVAGDSGIAIGDAPGAHALALRSSAGAWTIEDGGFAAPEGGATVASSPVYAGVLPVVAADIGFSGNGAFRFQLSNGGAWIDAVPGVPVRFPEKGNALRWRTSAETPRNGYHTPFLDRVDVRYWLSSE